MSLAKMTVDGHVQALAANLPAGRVWAPKLKQGSNLHGLLKGLAMTFEKMDTLIQCFIDQSYPPETVDFLEEWEAALGIPDTCFPLAATIPERQLIVEIKMITMRGMKTEADFVALAALFGLPITVNSGWEHVAGGEGGPGLYLPVVTLAEFAQATAVAARNTMVVVETYPDEIVFPWTFETTGLTGLLFATDGQTTLRCLINKLKPANVDVLFVEAP